MLVRTPPPRGYGRDRRSGLLLPADLRLARVPVVAGAGVDNPAAAAAARDLYLPNNLDVFGFVGALATRTTTTNTDTTITSPTNLTAYGWHASTGSGTISYRQANPLAGRPLTLTLATGAVSGNNAVAWGVLPLTTTNRTALIASANPFLGGYTKLVLEAFVIPSSLATADYIIGFADTNGDPVAAAAHVAGCLFQASVDATNWLAYTSNGAATTKTSTGVAASTAAVNRIKVEWSNGSVRVTVNGTAAAALTTTFPTNALMPMIGVWTRTAAAREVDAEFAIDRFE